jgi:hypothetical protein
VVTLHSPEEQDFSGETLEEALAWCPAWLIAPEFGIGSFFASSAIPVLHFEPIGTIELREVGAEMTWPACRLVLGVLIGGASLATVGASAPVAAQSCDPAYVSHCVPAYSEVGDLNCDYLYAQGISGIVLADPYNDPHGLDGWNYVDDGYGCEGYS